MREGGEGREREREERWVDWKTSSIHLNGHSWRGRIRNVRVAAGSEFKGTLVA